MMSRRFWTLSKKLVEFLLFGLAGYAYLQQLFQNIALAGIISGLAGLWSSYCGIHKIQFPFHNYGRGAYGGAFLSKGNRFQA